MIAPLLMAVALLPSGTYRYETSIGGHSVGSSTIVIGRNGGTLDIGESASLAGRSLISERKIREATFANISYVADASGQHAALTFSGNEATLSAGAVHSTIAAPAGAPFVVSDNMVAGFALIPAALRVTGAKELTLACICGAFVAVPVTVAGHPAVPPAGVPSGDAAVTVEVEGQTGTLWFNPQTEVLDYFELPAQELTIALRSYDPKIVPLAKPVAATTLPLPPARYTSRDVAIKTDDGVTLAGTLTVPNPAATPLPGFVLVHGSGCNDRDETIGPNKIFAQLANRLSNDGYAVLRYDKRSCGKSGGKFPVRDRLIADARDAIAYLRSQPGIDPKRIYVLGHSEGGELAPSIAIADGRLRGIVLLAPPALPLEQILKQQTAPQRNRAESRGSGDASPGATRCDRIGQEAGRAEPMVTKLVRNRSGGAHCARSLSDFDPSRNERHPSLAGRHAAPRAGGAKRASRRNGRYAARRRSSLHQVARGRAVDRR